MKYFFALLCFGFITACLVVAPAPPKGVPTHPSLTSIPTYPPTPVVTPSTYEVTAPSVVMHGSLFQVKLKAQENEEVKIYADKTVFISPMLWNGEQKYLHIKLNSVGTRTLDFKIDGQWKASVSIFVD